MSAKHSRTQDEMPPIKLTDSAPFISREDLLPGGDLSYRERLSRAGAVNVADNAVIEYVGGYMRVRAVNPDVRHGR